MRTPPGCRPIRAPSGLPTSASTALGQGPSTEAGNPRTSSSSTSRASAAGSPVLSEGRMGQVVGDLLPLAVGVAISPIPIIAVILMLLAPKAGGTSAGFLIGWVAGIAVATTAFLLLAGTLELGGQDEPSTAAS